MRLSDFLGADVVDGDGRSAGRVYDVRLVQDGPQVGGFDHGFRVHGLVVGRGGLGSRLGYERGTARGPWLLRVLFGRHAPRFVPWGRIAGFEARRVLIDGSVDDLPDAEPLPGREVPPE